MICQKDHRHNNEFASLPNDQGETVAINARGAHMRLDLKPEEDYRHF